MLIYRSFILTYNNFVARVLLILPGDERIHPGKLEDGLMELSFEVFDVFGLVSSMLTTLRAKMSETRTSVKVVMDPCTKKRLTLKNISADKSRILMILGTAYGMCIRGSKQRPFSFENNCNA
jgi:hypothetical protein